MTLLKNKNALSRNTLTIRKIMITCSESADLQNRTASHSNEYALFTLRLLDNVWEVGDELDTLVFTNNKVIPTRSAVPNSIERIIKRP